MKYHDGLKVMLGDVVTVPVPDGKGRGRVVMRGDTLEHLNIDEHFVEWVKRDNLLDKHSIVIEWIEKNPFEHNDPKYAPVGNMLFSPIDEFVELVERRS